MASDGGNWGVFPLLCPTGWVAPGMLAPAMLALAELPSGTQEKALRHRCHRLKWEFGGAP